MNTLQLNKKGVNGRTLNVVGLDGRSVSFPLRTPESEPISPYIKFADPEVKRICVENWGSDGEITYEQAAAVTSIGTVFKENTAITEFNELNTFLKVTAVNNKAFFNCTSLEEIDLTNITSTGDECFAGCTSLAKIGSLENITQMGNKAFDRCTELKIELYLPKLESFSSSTFYPSGFSESGITAIKSLGIVTKIPSQGPGYNWAMFNKCPNLRYAILPNTLQEMGNGVFAGSSALVAVINLAVTPPTVGKNVFDNTSNCPIYVPDDGTGTIVQAYKTATNWSTYASRIFPISQLEIDNPELYAEVEGYL